MDVDDRTRVLIRRSRLQLQARYRRDRGQRLTTEAQGGTVQQIFGILDLRGCVPLKREQGVVAPHAASVVGNLYEFLPAGLDLGFDPRGSGIERILEQLLYHRRRPLY